MQSTSPYTPPKTELLDEQDEYGQIRIFSARGRIGRLRYIEYSIVATFIVYLIMVALSAAMGVTVPESMLGPGIMLTFSLGIVAMLIVNVLLTIQRCHDFNATGWLSLILLIPLAPLIFWFMPGTQGGNDFGAQPPPNHGVAVVVVLLIIVAVIGVLAAIAIPAYQEYVARAHELGM